MDRQDAHELLSSRLKDGTLTRRQALQVASALGLGAAFAPLRASAGSATPRRAASQADTGTVRFLIAEAFWANWHPYQHTAQIQNRLQVQVFDPLVRIETDDFGDYSPGLAESWEQLDDRTWEFKLREGITFHNGQPFTADDVKASIELASGATPEEVVIAVFLVPTTVEVVGPHTVRLRTETPYAPLLNILSTLPILSAQDIKAGAEALGAAPNGTGPFRLVNDEENAKTMEANPDYWDGPPEITTLIWEYIQDSQTRLNALLSGQAHIIDRVPPEHLPTLQGSQDVTLLSTTGLEVVNLLMRQDAPPPFNDPNLRRAIAWSIDRQALVDSLVGGASVVAQSHIPNSTLYAVPQGPAYTFDPERARAALAEAGFTDSGPEIDLHGTTGFLPRSQEVVGAIADGLQQTGFQPSVTITDVAGIVDALATQTGFLYHLSWSSSGDPHRAVNFIYRSSDDNVLGLNDPALDELVDAGAATVNPDARAQVYADLQAYLWDNVINLPLYNSDFTVAHVNELSGVTTLPNFMTYFNRASLTEG